MTDNRPNYRIYFRHVARPLDKFEEMVLKKCYQTYDPPYIVYFIEYPKLKNNG